MAGRKVPAFRTFVRKGKRDFSRDLFLGLEAQGNEPDVNNDWLIPEEILKASRFQEISANNFSFIFGADGLILAALGALSGRQEDPKIQHFGTRKHQMSEK